MKELTGDPDIDRDGEHTLGVVDDKRMIYFYEETPLGSPGASPHGTCSGQNIKPDAYTDLYTTCTGEAIQYTYEYHF